MAKYIFFTFPEYGHVNPTLAIVEALIARGEQVVYYLAEHFHHVIEATGATFRAFPFRLFDQNQRPSGGSRSPQGSQTRMALFSLFGTWAAQGLNPFFHSLAALSRQHPLGPV